jgi:hypothetical protein
MEHAVVQYMQRGVLGNSPSRCDRYAVFCTGVGIERALILVSSQKTLTVAVPVLTSLAQYSSHSVSIAAAAVAVVPCVFVHLLQTFIDFVIVAQWMRQDRIKAKEGLTRPSMQDL